MSPLVQIIYGEMAKQGAIPFARFMELALYCPECGFYEREEDSVGRGGDFYTSVSVGPLFGELLAFQCARWGETAQGADGGLRIVEAGAHQGHLARDVLGWLKARRPKLSERTEYVIQEPSPRRREWQRRTLVDFAAQVTWTDGFSLLRSAPGAPQFTIVLANELLDAMPVRRFGWDAAQRTWFEWGVGMADGRFVWSRLSGEVNAVTLHLPSSPELLDVLPDGYVFETSPAAEQWWQAAAGSLTQGKLLTCDYGFGSQETVSPGRLSGTLRAHCQHRQSSDVLSAPGEQDLTAHVDFSRIEAVGCAAGLRTELFDTQARYLTGLAAEAWKPEAQFGTWDARRTRQFQTLTHPEHLGRSFRVLIQSR